MLFFERFLKSSNSCSVCVSVIIECEKSAASANQPKWIIRIRLPWAVTDYIIVLKGTRVYSVKKKKIAVMTNLFRKKNNNTILG